MRSGFRAEAWMRIARKSGCHKAPMKEIDSEKPILVTGGGGYIASWILRYLLEDGRTVRATVRSKSPEKTGHLTRLAEGSPGTLELFEADLTRAGSFDEAMAGCELVMHTASPFFIEKSKDPEKELIGPARDGTRIVLEGANRTASVKRIVLTSSVAAVMGDAADIKNIQGDSFTEEHWNESSDLSHNPYPFSKTLAEREAWKIVEAQDRWDLLVINPSFVLGPALSDRSDSTSVNFMRDMVNGRFATGCPPFYFGVVDVRDVARAHILAGFTPGASGRHITSADTVPFLDMANILREKYGSQYKIPKKQVPAFMLYLIGPLFGLSWKYVARNAGIAYRMDNSYSKKDLGLEYRPIKETLIESIEQLEKNGQI